MKILVAVKRVIDPYVKIRVKGDGTGVDKQNIKMSMNPFDEIAMEQAIRLLEQKIATEVIAVTVGTEASQETLRQALALGANRAILVSTAKEHCSLNIAKILQKIVNDEKPDLVLMGKQAIDGDNNQTPQMLAALLDWPQATFVSGLTMNGDSLEAVREVDGGLETLGVNLPAVISVDLRLNEPRYASLPNIMKAKSKPLTMIALETMGLELKEHIEVLSVTAPPTRSGGVKVDSVEELINKLKHEAKVL
ncbi:Electron transfer flavoprotein small subunit [Legionella massiliensis]|uniref:Electron transfer flavoprotein subunit beta n=1 Tax=Legionella massiliensis TaxID=1034943 RepID=A0A078L3E4_9GAMM|nr:electron transfer flavoprotein subunit beta/FixA family protein [Legionella massiliensis]CDZ78644.1 Electron transfer flavoprotein small subunit [Legionella massiliensis]CEE14382.1 Electron transfer flavoprotein subunit beta [Legionella massiliensis]